MSISLVSQRVFKGATDISVAVVDYRIGTQAVVYTAGEYIYIGTTAPMTNTWLELSTPSGTSAGAPLVEVWWANAWAATNDIIDQTAGLTTSGRISWVVDYFGGWDIEQKSETVGISGSNIYDRYWLRISWPSSYTATFSYIGQKFSDDLALAAYYPDLLVNTQLLTGFKSGKTNWDEQHFMAAEKIVKDLRKRNMIKDKNQVFDWQTFEEASCHKVAEIAYSAFGTPYRESMNLANKAYNEEIARALNLDTNMNGKLEVEELRDTQGWMTR